jgi:hypothetical protein
VSEPLYEQLALLSESPQRSTVTLEPLRSDELELSAEEQHRILREWAERGPQGPLDADDA